MSQHHYLNRLASARKNDATSAAIHGFPSAPIGEGAFRWVYKGKYTAGRRTGQQCVSKTFKSGSVYEAAYFDNDVKTVQKTIELVDRWNALGKIEKKIMVNEAAVWTFDSSSASAGQKSLVEPFIDNWEKFNSNTGWSADNVQWGRVMQALSHYSYHASSGQCLLCDLQGGICSDGAIISDPAIVSRARSYGPTDLGDEGVRNFFAYHKCNEYCSREWTKPRNAAPIFTPMIGTSMDHPQRVMTRQSRPAMSRQR